MPKCQTVFIEYIVQDIFSFSWVGCLRRRVALTYNVYEGDSLNDVQIDRIIDFVRRVVFLRYAGFASAWIAYPFPPDCMMAVVDIVQDVGTTATTSRMSYGAIGCVLLLEF